jgi:predicted AAA+ superfamily ATPase
MHNKEQALKELKEVVSSYCKVCKAMNIDKLVSCPCDEKLHCEEVIAFVRGSDSSAIVFGAKGSGYEVDAKAIREHAEKYGMRPVDVIYHATAKYMEIAP